MLLAKTIERKLELARRRLDPLLEREEHLSKYGFWEIGYLKGQISILEDWLDELLEDNNANNQEEKCLKMNKHLSQWLENKEDARTDSETFAEHYDCEPFDYQKWLKNTESSLPKVNLTDIPACCVKCSNHPSNGGSGICNCVAPYLNQTTCTMFTYEG